MKWLKALIELGFGDMIEVECLKVSTSKNLA